MWTRYRISVEANGFQDDRQTDGSSAALWLRAKNLMNLMRPINSRNKVKAKRAHSNAATLCITSAHRSGASKWPAITLQTNQILQQPRNAIFKLINCRSKHQAVVVLVTIAASGSFTGNNLSVWPAISHQKRFKVQRVRWAGTWESPKIG